MSDNNPKHDLKFICEHYMKNNSGSNNEIEVRFGTQKVRQITQIDYTNVINKIKSIGYSTQNSFGDHILKIIPYQGDKTSNIRFELSDMQSIQEYCKTNDIKRILSNNYKINVMKKINVFHNNKIVPYANFTDFGFRVSYSNETSVQNTSKIIDNWDTNNKVFRYMNRVSFYNKQSPFRIDLSITQMSTGVSMQESNVLSSVKKYEIEVELLNDSFKKFYKSPEQLAQGIKDVTKHVLSGIQKTSYPISYVEQKRILNEYLKMIYIHKFKNTNKPFEEQHVFKPFMFIGPSSKTLQLKNITQPSDSLTIPNIRLNYTVTEKADGERRLLYISDDGKIYFITTTMDVIFTGKTTNITDLKSCLIDGEYISHNKKENVINIFMAFDTYFIKNKDIRHYPFIPSKNTIDEYKIFRYHVTKDIIEKLNIDGISVKKFYPEYPIDELKNMGKIDPMIIFKSCKQIFDQIDNGHFDYNTDGLIFTPMDYGVGSNKIGTAGPYTKITWKDSFKWKPVKYDTVDFLVITKKDFNGDDIISTSFTEGTVTVGDGNDDYKTIILRCGYDEKRDGFINPCNSLLNDEFEIKDDSVSTNEYKHIQFRPSEPYDPDAGIVNISLNGNSMITEEGDVFDDNTIVEFRYDKDRPKGWRWIPLRIRNDKTSELRRGLPNFGNAYTVANDIWYSIHYPITQDMISTGKKIPLSITDNDEDDVYYRSLTKSNKSYTERLRNFHNLFVKKILIKNVSESGNTLIDYACGKGGDFPKWISAELSFVFGIDISKDNIENKLNGACVRFLKYKREYKDMPYALFINGDSSKYILSGETSDTEKDKKIINMVFGKIPRTEGNMPSAVLRQYGVGKDGFDISSCQFAIHYMFKNIVTFHTFIRNVSECTKIGGYFIGTTYDGKTIFDKLKIKKKGEGFDTYADGVRIWEIIKQYSDNEFLNDETSLGKVITIYQESINQYIDEYLVNYEYFKDTMNEYGFEEISPEESKQMDTPIPFGSGMFSTLYNIMISSSDSSDNKSMEMKPYEKNISDLNRYFIFKKIRNVQTSKVSSHHISNSKRVEEVDGKEEEEEPVKKIYTKLNKTIKLTIGMQDSSILDLSVEKSKHVSIIVPFRDMTTDGTRKQQLTKFIDHMKKFMGKQSYKIHVIVQSDDDRKFNRGALLNIGFKESEEHSDLFIFHDVDLLPSKELYSQYITVPTKGAMHIASAWNRYQGERYFGGVVAFNKSDFNRVNGYPNTFWGWGGEDDALRFRMDDGGIPVEKSDTKENLFEDLEGLNLKEKQKYLKENPELKAQYKWERLDQNKNKWREDGLTDITWNNMSNDSDMEKYDDSEVVNIQTVFVMPDVQDEETKLDYVIDKKKDSYDISKFPLYFDNVDDCKNKGVKLPYVTNVEQLYELIPDTKEFKTGKGNLESPLYDNLTSESIRHTFDYLFYKIRMGVFVYIKDNQLFRFVPFYNMDFENEWSNNIDFVNNSSLDDYIKEKKKYLGKSYNEDYETDVKKWSANNCLLGTWKDDEVGDMGWYETREMIVDMCKSHKIGDCIFFYNRRDHPVLTNNKVEPYFHLYNGLDTPLKSHSYINYAPIVGYSKNNNFADILIPTYADWREVTQKIYPSGCADINTGKIVLDWNKKKNIAMFRGSATGCGTNPDTNQRIQLAVLSTNIRKKGKKFIDAGLVGSNFRDKKFEEETVSYFKRKDYELDKVSRIPMNEQSKYKYIIHVDGHVSAYRLGKELSLGSCILKVDSLYDYRLWFSDKLIEYDGKNERVANYIKIEKDMSNLEEKIEWCIENDDICSQIAKNSLKLYNEIINKEYIVEYCSKIVNNISSGYGVKQIIPATNALSRFKIKNTTMKKK